MSRFNTAIASAALFFSLTGIAATAFAHAHPKTMTPAKDAVVTTAPAEVAITYTEGLTAGFSKIDVTDHDGQAVAAGPSTIDAKDKTRMSVPLKPLQPGVYTVHWIAVADDGHRTQGDYGFTVK